MDIGAFQGRFTDAALAYWRPDRVWLVEANPDMATALREKYRRRSECHIIHAAIADRSGTANLRVNECLASSSILPILPDAEGVFGQTLAERQVLAVPARSLDALFEEHDIDRVDLMKVDIQGAERQLIEGGRHALKSVGGLYIEVMFNPQYAGAAGFEELYRLLCDAGFRLRGLSKGRLGTDGALAYADALFVRPAAVGERL
jgi:FkbM family methyltransferase